MRNPVPVAMAALAVALPPVAPAAEDGKAPWLKASVYLDHEALARGASVRAAVVLDLEKGYHVNANPPSLDFQKPTRLTPAPHAGITWGKVRYPGGEPFAADWAGDTPVRVYAGRTILVVPGTVATDAPLGPVTLRFTLAYQGCDESTCYRTADRTLEASAEIVPAGADPAPANASVFEAAGAGRESGRAPPSGGPGSPAEDLGPGPDIRFEGEADLSDWFRQGLIVALPLLFVGGLALNLTPCVFPLIPVTMNFFAAQGESRPAKVLPLAGLYVLGLAVTFSMVGLLAALAGKSLGLVLQSPWGVLGVVFVLAVMMASSFGAFEIRLPSGAVGRLGGRRGLVGAAFMGMVMGAIAAPCVGPFLLSLITAVAKVAAEQSTGAAIPLGAGAFFTVGLGLGLPYVFLGAFTSLINRFPHGGGWLIWTKRLLGMGLAGLILYFLRPYVAPAFFWPLVLGLFVVAAGFLGFLEGLSRRPFSKAFWTVRIVVAVALLVGGIAFYTAHAPEAPAADHATGAPGAHMAWTPWRPGTLERAKEAGRPVLLYFGADWCSECRVWKAGIFSRPEVVRAGRPLERIYVDLTEEPTGDKRDFVERYRSRNPPAVIILDGRGHLVKAWREPPEVDAFVEALKTAAPPR